IYAVLNQQGVSTSPRYLNAGLTQDQLRSAAQASFTELYTVLGDVGPYLGAVATRTFINDLTSASTAGWNCRTAHHARDDISSLQLVFNNIYVVPGTGETAIPGTQTITASVEYPAGTFTQVKFNGGNTSVVLSGLTQIVSDPVAVSIPNGAKFFTRRYQVVSSTIAFVNNTSRS
ncbi:hypothetical protein K7461_29410, partial [Pseudomonas fluorescens]|uniref:hypothetical protein n=1 Tax=Pseudomonas fluorescens TaxID=294 RepID=UPI001CA6F4C6